MTTRILKKGRVYRGQRRVYWTFMCAAVAMILTSVLFSMLGFYGLINLHIDQAVRISKVKNLQIIANTLADLSMNKLSVDGSN